MMPEKYEIIQQS